MTARVLAALLALCSMLPAQTIRRSVLNAGGMNIWQAQLLFATDFESASTLNTPTDCGSTECYQTITGTDASTGYTWPPPLWGSQTTWNGGGWFQLQTYTPETPATIGNYIDNSWDSVNPHSGSASLKMLNQTVKNGHLDGQDPYQITPDVSQPQGDFYVRYWLKLQPDTLALMCEGQNGDGTWCDWRALAEYKTGGQANGGSSGCVPGGPTWGGDYRNIIFIIKSAGALKWRVQADNNANGGLPFEVFWQQDNTSVTVPIDQWFLLEWFVHPSPDSSGRIWVAVNGFTIADYNGVTMNTPAYHGGYSCPINRIIPFTVYSTAGYPSYQHVDGFQLWNGFPLDASPH